VPVGRRAFEIIEVLAELAEKLVTKAERTDRIWQGVTVTENTLHVQYGGNPQCIGSKRSLLKTESGRGYRLVSETFVFGQAYLRAQPAIQYTGVDGRAGCGLAHGQGPSGRARRPVRSFGPQQLLSTGVQEAAQIHTAADKHDVH
jgi:hypothetical protein